MKWSRLALLALLIALPMMACGPSNPCDVTLDTTVLKPLNRSTPAGTNSGTDSGTNSKNNSGGNLSTITLPIILRDASSEAAFRRSELSNPLRGAFNWIGRVPLNSSELKDPENDGIFSPDDHAGPIPEGGTPDVYHRFPWRWFFKNGNGQDAAQFDFALLDQYLDRAVPADSGRKIHLGFMALGGRVGDVANLPRWRGNSSMPDYIREHMMRQNPPRGVYFTEQNRASTSSYRRNPDPSWWRKDASGHFPDWFFWPDWNDPWFVSQIELFMRALAEHKTSLGVPLRDDPRLGGLEVRFYGRWGEWHLSGLGYDVANRVLGLSGKDALGMAPDEPSNPNNARRRIIEAHAKNFPNTRLTLLTGNQDNPKTLRWTLEQYPNAGWRRDSFLSQMFERPLEQVMDVVRSNGGFDINDPVISNRWMTAPIWAERGGGCDGADQSPQLGPGLVERLHVGPIANHLGDEDRFNWRSLSNEDRKSWFEAVLRSGFRLQINQINIPASIKRGEQLEVALTWDNVGVAPVYEAVNVMLELRRNGKTAWSGRSGLDLRKLLPSDSTVPGFLKNQNLIVSPYNAKDSFVLPNTLEPGNYGLWLKAIDPISGGNGLQRRYARQPLRLAHPDRSDDGAYPVGNLEVK